MTYTYKEAVKKIPELTSVAYDETELMREISMIEGDEDACFGQLQVITAKFFPEPKEDWQMAIRLLAQNREL